MENNVNFSQEASIFSCKVLSSSVCVCLESKNLHGQMISVVLSAVLVPLEGFHQVEWPV
jgi:hypothetical protein